MDFIPNHTGKKSEWFIKSQKKEDKFKDFYIWEACDPNSGSYPNNWVSFKFLQLGLNESLFVFLK
jgi:oligo-1,6-glucosidase